MTAGVGKARPPRSFPTGLAKCLRPGAQTQTVEKPRIGRKPRFLRPGCSIIRASLTVARMVSLPSQISAFCALAARSPCICSHLRVALRCAQQPTGLTLPSGALRVALPPPVASAHRAHASLRAFGRSQRSGKCCGIRLWGAEGKRRPRGLPGEAQSDPQVRRREVSALWAAKRSAKRPAGAPEGSVSPVGCCRQRRQSDPKA